MMSTLKLNVEVIENAHKNAVFVTTQTFCYGYVMGHFKTGCLY